MLNVISVDVEEYFHAANLEPVTPPRLWHSLSSRVEYNTNLTLEILEKYRAKATFFILGYVAQRHPILCKRVADAGHEIAAHGYGHRLAYLQNPKQFFRDVRRTKLLLEDITNKQVVGYRAPNFSICSQNLWAYEKLLDAGYIYDSSLYPVSHPRYGNVERALSPEIVETPSGKLFIFPLAVYPLNLLGHTIRFPIAGGGYFRLLPKCYWLSGLKQLVKQKKWFITYFHPWELDTGQPRFDNLSCLSKLRHYHGIDSLDESLGNLLETFSFTSLNIAAKQSFTNFPNFL